MKQQVEGGRAENYNRDQNREAENGSDDKCFAHTWEKMETYE
jgi:hypothetical protein